MIERNLSNIFFTLGTSKKGGMVQITSPKGGSTQFAISCLEAFFRVDPPSPSSSGFFIWISDEVSLYPPALRCHSSIPLSHWVLVKPKEAADTWRVALEAAHTGLFPWILLRPSRACSPAHLRRLQLAVERTRTKIFLLGKVKFPHWLLNVSLEVDRKNETDSLYPELFVRQSTSRGMFFAHA